MFLCKMKFLKTNYLITLKTNTERQSFILWLSKFLEFLCRLKYIPECTVLELNVKILLNWKKVMKKKKKKDFVGQSLYLFLPLEPFFFLWPSQPERQLLPLTYCTYLKRIVWSWQWTYQTISWKSPKKATSPFPE